MTIKKAKSSRIVYSTGRGKMCPTCGHPIGECVCVGSKFSPANDGIVRVEHQTKGRKGKGVTVIRGASLDPLELAKLGKQLRKKCGTGGTVKNGKIEIQGDHRDMLVEELKKLGWVVKRCGG